MDFVGRHASAAVCNQRSSECDRGESPRLHPVLVDGFVALSRVQHNAPAALSTRWAEIDHLLRSRVTPFSFRRVSGCEAAVVLHVDHRWQQSLYLHVRDQQGQEQDIDRDEGGFSGSFPVWCDEEPGNVASDLFLSRVGGVGVAPRSTKRPFLSLFQFTATTSSRTPNEPANTSGAVPMGVSPCCPIR